MAGVLERRLLLGEHWLLAHDAAVAHGLQRPGQGEDAPVALAELNGQVAEVLKANAIAPL